MNHHTSSFSSDLSVLILCEQELRWERNHKRRKEEIRTRLQSGESGSDFLSLVLVTGIEPVLNCLNEILSFARNAECEAHLTEADGTQRTPVPNGAT